MEIKRIMSNTLYRIDLDEKVSEAVKLMDRKNIGSLIVTRDGKDVGIITERDILKKIVAAEREPRRTLVKDIMSSPLITIDENSTLEKASEMIKENKIRRLIVKSGDDIVGIINTRDLAEGVRYSIGTRLIDKEYTRPPYARPE